MMFRFLGPFRPQAMATCARCGATGPPKDLRRLVAGGLPLAVCPACEAAVIRLRQEAAPALADSPLRWLLGYRRIAEPIAEQVSRASEGDPPDNA